MIKKFLIILTLMIFSCKNKNQITDLNQQNKPTKDSISKTEKAEYFQYKQYKVGHVNDEYGKRLYIDSLHYNIIKRYYKSDSTKLWFINSSDFVNDTVLRKEYYKNGNLKLIRKTTYRNFIPIGTWKYYSKNGKLEEEKKFDKKYKISFNEAIKIAKQNGIKKPYQTQLKSDSVYWEIMNWKNIKFDTITNRGIDEGKGVLINRQNGKTKVIKRERNWVR